MRLLTETDRAAIAEKGMTWGLGSLISYLFGLNTGLLMILVLFIFLDYLTGISSAFIQGELNSRVGLTQGSYRKLLMFVPVVMAVQLDRLSGMDPALFTILTTWALIANEGLSDHLKTSHRAGVPIPGRLQAALAGLRDRADEQ